MQWAIVPKYIANEAIKSRNYKIYELTHSPPDYNVYKLTHMKQTLLKQKALEAWDSLFQKYF